MYNEEKKQVKTTTVILPPIQSNNVDIGEKRTVPWLEEENDRETKISRTEKQIYNSSDKRPFVKPNHIQQQQQMQVSQPYNDQPIIQQRTTRAKLKLDDFNISRTLGTGSFGRVHLIQSKVNSRFYAIKVLKKQEVIRLKQVEHTNNEKHILEFVAHPFLVNMWHISGLPQSIYGDGLCTWWRTL
ncbi:unnamed protein product [Rhizopus stolonifer]